MGRPRKYPIREAVCEKCGKVYTVRTGDRGRFCSNKCRRNRVKKTCPWCQKTYSVRASKAHRYNYCSIKCRKAATKDARTDVECEGCGKTFTVIPSRDSRGDARFCSYECQHEQGRTTIVCTRCGKERILQKYRVEKDGQEFCGNRCATIYRMENTIFMPGYIANKRRTGYRTDIESMTEEVLIAMDLPYEFEKKIGRYSVDFILTTLGIALECDGWHHTLDKVRERDKRRDKYLNKRGWIVVRIPDADIRECATAAVMTALSPFLDGSSQPIF